MNKITSNKFFIPGFAAVVTLIVVLILVVFRGGVPSNDVAKVSNIDITKTQFNKTLGIFAAQSQPNAKGKAVLPDPPNYPNCIANLRKTAAKKATTASLKAQCVTQFTTAKDSIMTSLIQSAWYQLEAKDRGINVSAAEVQARFAPLKAQTFPKAADYQKFLASTGQTQADLLKLVKNQIYQEKIQAQVAKTTTPTASQIEAAYNKNKSQYSTPASRDLLIVFNSKKPKADAAYAAIKSGTSFADAAKKYSQDSASKKSGGKFPGVTKGQFETQLDNAVFSAPLNKLEGPIKTQFGYYVFEVTAIKAKKQQTLQQATPTIKQTLTSAATQKATDEFQTSFQKKWKKKTHCAALYKVALCNGVKTPVTGATGAASSG